jgi:hypothetical protein
MVNMRRGLPILTLLLILALLAMPALAQETANPADAPQGLGVMMLLVGLGAAAFVGYSMSRREASDDEDDLV